MLKRERKFMGCGGQQAGAHCARYEPMKANDDSVWYGEYGTL